MSKQIKKESSGETPSPTPKRKKKWWLRILGVIFILLGLLVVATVIARDAIIRSAVVKIGTAVTGTKVELDSFSSSFGGTVEIGGFRVANPEGYRDNYAFQVSKVRVSLSLPSILTKKIVVKEVFISGTDVNYELKIDGSSNLTDIKKNIDAFASSSKPAEKPQETPAEDKTEEKKAKTQMVIKLVTIEDSRLSISSSILNTRVPLPIPPLTLTDIGEGKSFGETIDEFSTAVLSAIMDAASKSGLKNVGDTLSEAGKNIGESLKGSGGTLTEAGKNIGDTVTGLFK